MDDITLDNKIMLGVLLYGWHYPDYKIMLRVLLHLINITMSETLGIRLEFEKRSTGIIYCICISRAVPFNI